MRPGAPFRPAPRAVGSGLGLAGTTCRFLLTLVVVVVAAVLVGGCAAREDVRTDAVARAASAPVDVVVAGARDTIAGGASDVVAVGGASDVVADASASDVVAVGGASDVVADASASDAVARATPEACQRACKNIGDLFLQNVEREASDDATLRALGETGRELARETAKLQLDYLISDCRKQCDEHGTEVQVRCLAAATSSAELERCPANVPPAARADAAP